MNIPGNHLKKGKVVAEYLPSGPRPGSGLHRYVFLVYKQSQQLHIVEHIPGTYVLHTYKLISIFKVYRCL